MGEGISKAWANLGALPVHEIEKACSVSNKTLGREMLSYKL